MVNLINVHENVLNANAENVYIWQYPPTPLTIEEEDEEEE